MVFIILKHTMRAELELEPSVREAFPCSKIHYPQTLDVNFSFQSPVSIAERLHGQTKQLALAALLHRVNVLLRHPALQLLWKKCEQTSLPKDRH